MERNPPEELDLPDGIETVEEAVELLRAWVGDGALMVSLNSTAFGPNVGDWGRLLAEVGHHVAKATALNGYMGEAEANGALRQAFLAAFDAVSPAASGRLKGRQEH